MKALFTALALAIGCATAHADDLQNRAIAAQAADVTITAAGLALVDGLAEANPAGILLIPAKAGALYYADQIADPIERANLHRSLSAWGWGATANNICAIAVVLTGGGGSAGCLLLIPAVGLWDLYATADMVEKSVEQTIAERAVEIYLGAQ